jgi:general secretion pathway protein F
MPAFRFEAVDDQGRSHKGVLEGESPRQVRGQLRQRGWVPLAVEAASAPEPSALGQWSSRPAFNGGGLVIWTRQLAGLVSAGLPLERALNALADEAETPTQREMLARLRADVNAGQALSAAMAQSPREFNEVYRAVVAAGEHSGALGQVLERLADDLEERQALRAKVLGAALYPAIVSVVALVIVMFLLTYVVPQIASVFTSSRKALPLLTVVMLAISQGARDWGWLMGLGTAAGVSALLALRRGDEFRRRSDAAWLRLPLVGRLTRSYNAARFASTLALLAESGVPILRALQAAAETLGNRAMRADALDALDQVREGAPLAAALAAKPRFPGLLPLFARLGEQTGDLPTMLGRAAQQLSSEVQRRSMALATILEPLLIVGMGGVVMLIVLAVLLPIIELNTFVR